MSARLSKCGDYLKAILKGSNVQGEALLVTASDQQVNCLSEIFYNLRRLPLGKKAKALVAKYRKVVDVIANLALRVKSRLLMVQKFAKKILVILMSVKLRILSLLTPSP